MNEEKYLSKNYNNLRKWLENWPPEFLGENGVTLNNEHQAGV